MARNQQLDNNGRIDFGLSRRFLHDLGIPVVFAITQQASAVRVEAKMRSRLVSEASVSECLHHEIVDTIPCG